MNPQNKIELLHHRLAQVAQTVQNSPEGLGLLGLGSVGVETQRLDAWSDLDFFVVVRPGTKHRWIQDPSWLSQAHPVAYLFKNTADGYKLLWDDGVFGEMAVFEPQDLASIPYAEGRWIWAHQDLDPGLRIPKNPGTPAWKPDSVDWCLGELLTCLYVGLSRYRRGEKLSAHRFIQSHCLDRFLEIIDLTQTPAPGPRDPYSRDRRFEDLYPQAAPWLPRFLVGLDQTPKAALAYLDWAATLTPLNPGLAAEIRRLSTEP